MDRPKLLFLAQTLPYPPDGGVHIRTFHILRLLATAFDVTALCFYRAATRSTAEELRSSVAALSALCRVETFPIPQEHRRSRLVLDHLRSVLSGRAYTTFTYASRAFRRRLRAHLESGRFGLVHVDSLDLAGYLPRLIAAGAPIVCVHHNVESDLLRRRALVETSPPRARYLRYQARLVETEERRWAGAVDLNVAVSEADRDRLAQLVPDARITIVPNGVDTDRFRPAPGAETGIVFVGGYSWFPNRDALDYFAAEILPRIRRRRPTLPVRWIGRAPPAVRSRFAATHGIDMTGYVDDIRPAVHDAACFVVPLRVGGGTRLKILDAWAMGKAVVSTSIGCEGLQAVDGQNILVRDTPGTFADAVVRLADDAALRHRIGLQARKTAERVYSWDVIGESMLETYRALRRDEPAIRRARALGR